MRQTYSGFIYYVKIPEIQAKGGGIMKRQILSVFAISMALLVASPLWAQRAAPGGAAEGGRAAGADSSGTSSAPAYSSTSSTSSYSYSGTSGYSGYVPELGNRGYTISPSRVVPKLEGTCFRSASDYNYWQNYYDYLYSAYHIYPIYFSRFTRNYEPKMTPAMLKIALRDPLVLTKEMLRAIDELETMLADTRTGKATDKDDIVKKSQEIRNFAKAIRMNPTIAVIDLSSKKVINTGQETDALDPEAIAKLREMALDLDRQFTNLYSLTSSSTVSADSLMAPSFVSQAKAIEKLCKNIEHATKKL